MAEIVKTMKLHIRPPKSAIPSLEKTAVHYAAGCNDVSQYIFDNGFPLNAKDIQKEIYHTVKSNNGLKSQMTISTIRTTVARYTARQEQLAQRPFRYKDEKGEWVSIPRTLEWLYSPIVFSRPQVDLVRGRDYTFAKDVKEVSINTLDGRVKAEYDLPKCFEDYFSGEWKFGTAKLVSKNGHWYLHIPMTRTVPDTFDVHNPSHIAAIDRGLRFLETIYDETGDTQFIRGDKILKKRETFLRVRAELQAKGTKSAKRKLKAISGRENGWMTDVNHHLSKALVSYYGKNTLFAIEDLTGVSFSEENLANRKKEQRGQLRSWAFYQLEQFLTYKAKAAGSAVVKFPAHYTSQRCPKCGRIHKENRKHKTHEYICDKCGFRSNDDRVGAMNIYELAVRHVAGEPSPRFVAPKEEPQKETPEESATQENEAQA